MRPVISYDHFHTLRKMTHISLKSLFRKTGCFKLFVTLTVSQLKMRVTVVTDCQVFLHLFLSFSLVVIMSVE